MGSSLLPPIEPGVPFRILDHPDGALGPPSYALRLDGLDGDTANDFTFTADRPDTLLTILWDDVSETIVIEGTVFGGQVESNAYIAPQLWEVEFVYTGVTDLGDRLEVRPAKGGVGVGSIMATETLGAFTGGQVIGLVDKADVSGLSFLLDRGHRLPHDDRDHVTGHGWLTHDNGDRVAAQDWLFKVGQPIPEPGMALLLGLGLAGLASVRRER